MGINKQYSGYQSFDFLEKGKDYKPYELIEGQSLFAPNLIPLSEAQEKRVNELAEKLIMISLHEHPVLFPADISETMAYGRQVRVSTAFEALSNSYWDAIFDNFMDGTALITSKSRVEVVRYNIRSGHENV